MSPEVFISLEESLAATINARWRKIAADLLQTLEPLLKAGRFNDAYDHVNRLNLNGLVQDETARIEELLVSALLFGAHNAAGSVSKTSFVASDTPLPDDIRLAIHQLVIMVEVNGAEFLRKEMMSIIRDEEVLARMMKADYDPQSRSLYVHRPLSNANDLVQWAAKQGFPSTLAADDFHVTICYSKAPVVWSDTAQQVTSLTVEGGERRVHRFGDAVVLLFESPDLQARHQEFLDIGARWDHDQYRPHVTLTYDPDFNIEGVEPYQGPLVFNAEVFGPVKDNWADDIEEVELRKAELSLAERLNNAVLSGKRLAVDASANLTTSRLVTLGYLAEAKNSGFAEYEINEVLDDRTCPVCMYMHGKRFKVEDQYHRTVQALRTQDPKELKELAPWPKQSKAGLHELRSMTIEQLQAAGISAPPFHISCRGMITNVGTTDELMPLGQLPISDARPSQAPVVQQPQRIFAPASAYDDLVANNFTKPEIHPRSIHGDLPDYIEETDALYEYVGSGYFEANKYLRGIQQSTAATEYGKEIASEVQRLFKPTTEDFITYRGIPDDLARNYAFGIGDTIEFAGFTSTSRAARIATGFGGEFVFQIRVPRGTNAIVTNTSEYEVILPDKVKFKVISKHEVPSSAGWPKLKTVVLVEVVQ